MTGGLNLLKLNCQFHCWLSHSGRIAPLPSDHLPKFAASYARNRPGLIFILASQKGIDAHTTPSVSPFADSEIIPPGIPPGGTGDPTEATSALHPRYVDTPAFVIAQARRLPFSPQQKCTSPCAALCQRTGVP